VIQSEAQKSARIDEKAHTSDVTAMKIANFDPNSNHVQELNGILKLNEEQIFEYQGLFVDPKLLSQHWQICKGYFNDPLAIKINQAYKKEFSVTLVCNVDARILYLNQIKKETGFSVGGNGVMSCGEAYALSQSKTKWEEYQIKFKQSRNAHNLKTQLTTSYNCVKHIVKMMKQLYGSEIVSARKGRDNDGNLVYIYSENTKSIKHHEVLYRIRNPLYGVDQEAAIVEEDEEGVDELEAVVESSDEEAAEDEYHYGDEMDTWINEKYGDEYDWSLLSMTTDDEKSAAYEILSSMKVLDDDGECETGIAVVHRVQAPEDEEGEP
jgi:hypothetical protein